MQYAKLGDTGLIVSRACLGVMTFGVNTANPALGKVDQDGATRMVAAALDAGVNFFDAADIYSGGQSEEMLGRALGARRKDVVIATKLGFRSGAAITEAGLSRHHVIAACEASLKRLNTDYIDLYQAHKEDAFTPLEETLEALDRLVQAGKVRYLGFSNWSSWRAAIAVQMQKERAWARFASGQYHYSLLNREVEHDIAPLLRHAGLGMLVWSPLGGGFLSGKYTRENIAKEGRHAAFDIVPFDREKGFALVEAMRGMAERAGCTVAQLALAWLLSKPVVTSVLIGSAKLAQLEDNLAAVGVRLDAEMLQELDRLTAPAPIYPHWFNARLTDAKVRDGLAASTGTP
ncbi:MAG: aldo/keto reductase [Hydrogenophilaceae bacterium]|jgi:aryl-alcohol dehydrogenase-like predicted oxidoreductase|nr:aldo/keto reductase [Hydrogenophilaceae bacterium]